MEVVVGAGKRLSSFFGFFEYSGPVNCSIGNVLDVSRDIRFEVVQNAVLREGCPDSFIGVYEEVVSWSAYPAVFMCSGHVGAFL